MLHGGSETLKDDVSALLSLPSSRVLCWVLTSPATHVKARAVKDTWADRCDRTIFVSSEDNEELGAIAMVPKEGRQQLWAKTKAAFSYVFDKLIDEYDWVMKADDDTYVIVENLRYMLR